MMVGQPGRLSASLTLFGYEPQQLNYRAVLSSPCAPRRPGCPNLLSGGVFEVQYNKMEG
jgi:hypothetical protein